MEENSKYKWQIFSGVSATLSVFSNAWVTFWLTPTLLKFKEPNSPFQIDGNDTSLLASLWNYGGIIGSLVGLFLSDRLGRKFTFTFAAIPFISACLIIAFLQDFNFYILARFLAGIGSGLVVTSVPPYLSEISSPEIRGFIVNLYLIQTYMGALFCFTVIPLTSIKINAIFMSIASFILLATSFWIPESPYFYLLRGQDKKALKSLEKLRNKSSQDEMEIMKSYMIEETQPKEKIHKNILKFICTKPNSKKFFILFVLFFANMSCGRLSIKLYSQIMIHESGSLISANVSGVVFSFVSILIVYPSTIFLEKYGRRPLMLWSTISTIVPLFIISVYYFLKYRTYFEFTKSEIFNLIPLAMIILYLITYAFGLDGIPYIFIGELFPTNCRSIAGCMIYIYYNILGIFYTYFHQFICEHFGQDVAFFIYTILTVICAIVIYYVMPETKGQTLEQIQENLKK